MIETMDSSGRILIADNDESVLITTTDLLRKAGYPCTPARDGLEALQALEANEYDLLIAEIQMPGNEELELVRAARFFAPNMPVIIFTAYPSLPSAIASIQLRVTAYLVKPVEFSTLVQHVKTNIAGYHAFKRKETFVERTMVFTWAIEETIQVLADTRNSFKSRRLSGLRRKLERLLASGRTE
jgi:DNA-binding NtrC family response regulator